MTQGEAGGALKSKGGLCCAMHFLFFILGASLRSIKECKGKGGVPVAWYKQ
jgi:hypothetical protein